MRHGQVVSVDRILEELWPRLSVDRGRRVLWVRVAGLRRMLKQGNADRLLQRVAPGYRLAVASDDIDAERFFILLERARCFREANNPAAAAHTLRQALDLWRGEPLADAQTGLVLEAEATRLADARMDATEDWIDAELACGRHGQVQAELCRLLTAHPLRERLWRQRVVALYRAGRAAEALATCHEFQVRLTDEFGLEPSDDLSRLEHDILQRDPSLVDIGPSALSLGMDDTSDDYGRRGPISDRHNLPAPLTRFVGRAAELEEVRNLLHSYRLVTLTGVGGVGKTRLALAAATAGIEDYPDGVWLVELAPRATADVPQALARALGVMVDSKVGAVADHLAGLPGSPAGATRSGQRRARRRRRDRYRASAADRLPSGHRARHQSRAPAFSGGGGVRCTASFASLRRGRRPRGRRF